MTRPTQTALFDGEQETPRKNDRPEAAALVEVLQALRTHSAVAWCERMNSGAHVVQAGTGRRFIRYGFKGCPDVLGMLRDGRLLACEVKATAGRLRPEQSAFLELVRAAGGLAFVARNCRDVFAALDMGQPHPESDNATAGLCARPGGDHESTENHPPCRHERQGNADRQIPSQLPTLGRSGRPDTGTS